ncbi:MAG: hypothetical protein QME51_08010, partial [Planctomycetota bacterium]|nr:hypothetical protein [Planctomycetota bacterium]
MKHRLLFFAGAFLALTLANILHATPPPKSYTLSASFKEGDKEIIRYKLEASARAETSSIPGHPPILLYSRLEQEIEQKILKLTDGEISRLERTYRSSKYYISKSSQQGKQEPLDGKKIVIESDGTITPANSASFILDEIKKFLSVNEHRFALILPVKEVKVKSEWEVPKEVVTRIFNFSNHKKRSEIHGCTEVGINATFNNGSLKCILKEVKPMGGQESAVIEMTLSLQGDDNGL